MSEKIKRPRDISQLVKLVVGITTGKVEQPKEKLSRKKHADVELGRLGGLKGGKSRAKQLTTEQGADMAKRPLKKMAT